MGGAFSFKQALLGKVEPIQPPAPTTGLPARIIDAEIVGPVTQKSDFQFSSQMDQGAVYQDRRAIKIQHHEDGSWSAVAVFESHGQGELPAMLQMAESMPKFFNSMFDLMLSIPGTPGGFKGIKGCVIPSLLRIGRKGPAAGS